MKSKNAFLENKINLEHSLDNLEFKLSSVLTFEGDEVYHKHDFIEIFYVTSGKGIHIINDNEEEIRTGTLFFILPGIYHGFNRIIGNEFSHRDILIDFNLFQDVYRFLSNENFNKKLIPQGFKKLLLTDEELTVLNDLFTRYSKTMEFHENIILGKAAIGFIIGIMVKSQGTDKEHVFPEIIEQLLYKLSYNAFTQDPIQITLKEFHYNHSYLSRIFKQYTRKSMTDYINGIRIQRAETLLKYTDVPIKNIVSALGINSDSYFLKIFKEKHKISPIKYRKKF